jgi:hypothetical protein
MSSRANPASTPQELASRARRNRSIGKPGQPGRDDHAVRPIPAAKFPTSYSATDATTSSEVRSKSAYYSVIARAVARLPKNSRDARFALYDRAEVELAAELLQDPKISDERAAIERLALERAIRKIEGDARKREMPKQLPEQSPERHRRAFTSFLALCLGSLSVRFTHWGASGPQPSA